MKIIYLLCFLISLIVLACSSMLPEITKTQVEYASQIWPGIDSVTLSEGRELYIDKCSGCHGLKVPSRYTTGQWDEIMPEMAQKAKLNTKEDKIIYQYVITVAKNKLNYGE